MWLGGIFYLGGMNKVVIDEMIVLVLISNSRSGIYESPNIEDL